MKSNHINGIFLSCTPKEEQKTRMLHQMLNEKNSKTYEKSKKLQYFLGRKRWLRPAVACMICLLIVAGVAMFGGGNTFAVYAYGENIEITNTGVQLTTGTIHDGGEMHGNLVQMYINGENIKTIRFSCRNQYIDFTDWTNSRPNFSMEKQFTVSYGEKTSDYSYLVINWNPKSTISQLTDTKKGSIANLSEEFRNDTIVMEVAFLDGSKETKAIDITLEDTGKILAKLKDYEISKNDDFILNPQKGLTQKKEIDSTEKQKNDTKKYSVAEIEKAKVIVKNYYSGFSGDKEIVTIKYTESSPLLNSGIPDKYKDWEIIAFNSYEKSMPDIARTIILARENSQKEWVVINEGY